MFDYLFLKRHISCVLFSGVCSIKFEKNEGGVTKKRVPVVLVSHGTLRWLGQGLYPRKKEP